MCESLGGEHVETLRDGAAGGLRQRAGEVFTRALRVLSRHGGRNVVGRWVQEMLDRGEDEEWARAQRAMAEERAAGARARPKVKGAAFARVESNE